MESKVTQGYELFLEATQKIQHALDLSFLESIAENGSNIAEGFKTHVEDFLPDEKTQADLNDIYEQLKVLELAPEEWRKIVQLTLLFAMQEEAMQTNHQITPDSIAYLFAYFIEQLRENKQELLILDNAVGSGNGLMSVLNQLSLSGLKVRGIGVETDDLLLEIASINGELSKVQLELFHQDGARKHASSLADFAIADLPVGFYPDDDNAQQYLCAAKKEHTYAHHILTESAMGQVKEGGYGIFLLPSDLFKNNQSDLLINWLKEKVYLQAVIQLPENLFRKKNSQKSIFIFQNHGRGAKQVPVLASYLSSLSDKKKLEAFFLEFTKWKKSLKSQNL